MERLGEVAAGTPVNIAFLGSETIEQRLDAIATLARRGLQPVPILSARRLVSTEALESFLVRANDVARIKHVFLVGGDPTAPQGPFVDSMELMSSATLERFLLKRVGIAGYPDGHPKISDDVLWNCLHRKVVFLEAKGIEVEITTQLTLDADAVVSWVERVRQSGIQSLIRIGVPGPATVAGLLKFASQCRVATSLGFLEKHGWQIPSLLGRVGPERFLLGLQKELGRRSLGRIALHIFPLGDLSDAVRWFQSYCGRAS
ncbi:5,10-methylenetetrahydrofolate reductase [Paraburkholderia hospita]|uniref:5,10-methylenetetrahydrofolate reductase n=1 Tax=Paraburkholderia hospita TaxID=169430 RepID=A0ABN0FTM7_9BURK|nr:methylenetetrahydrofolate reductase [Paraburkholderia hospita]EIN02192.1 5,10-methylenetetrahydrofolate reductase [Paraburkholderia hospita]